MSDTPIRRSNWTSAPQGDADDPLAELERIIGRSPSAPQAKPPVSTPQNSNQQGNDFLGFSEKEFEAAFRVIEKQPSPAPVREGAVFRKEPLFDEKPPQDYSRNFAQTFEQEMAGTTGKRTEEEFETRADAFDFDRRALEQEQGNYENFKPATLEEPEPAYYMENRPRSGFVTVIGVTGLVFVAVIGALIYSWVGAKSTGEPITIKADQSPVKKMAAADTEQPTQNKLIYDRLGNTDEDTNNEKIVSREEQPVDNLQKGTEADEPPPPVVANEPATGSPASPRIILPNPSSQGKPPTPAQETGTLTSPKQVSTTTVRVRADGTMENVPSGNAQTAPAQQPTAVKPNIVASPPPKAMVPAVKPQPAPEETASADSSEEEASIPVTKTPQKTQTKQAPLRMASLPAQKTGTATAAASSGGFVVQISSQKSEDSARASFTGMQTRFPGVLAGHEPSIKAVTLGSKGTFYRVRVGPMNSREEAASFCGRLKAAGGDCVVTPN